MFACLLRVLLGAPLSGDPEVVAQHWTQQAGPQTDLPGWAAVPLQLLPWTPMGSSRSARPLLPVSAHLCGGRVPSTGQTGTESEQDSGWGSPAPQRGSGERRRTLHLPLWRVC